MRHVLFALSLASAMAHADTPALVFHAVHTSEPLGAAGRRAGVLGERCGGRWRAPQGCVRRQRDRRPALAQSPPPPVTFFVLGTLKGLWTP